MNEEIDYKKFEKQLLIISPHISEEQAEEIIKKLFVFWWNMIENIDLFKN